MHSLARNVASPESSKVECFHASQLQTKPNVIPDERVCARVIAFRELGRATASLQLCKTRFSPNRRELCEAGLILCGNEEGEDAIRLASRMPSSRQRTGEPHALIGSVPQTHERGGGGRNSL